MEKPNAGHWYQIRAALVLCSNPAIGGRAEQALGELRAYFDDMDRREDLARDAARHVKRPSSMNDDVDGDAAVRQLHDAMKNAGSPEEADLLLAEAIPLS